ncbi:T9SS type A sorting domain-containing protein [Terrimonas sp. NA20]|uniref:T9SS type A sorting domain-containing protein n=1 Tax=Terrimonas ginsenosidimutans TaxID=2908004 RepID=A0ABS9KRR0_9BACT|nr:T9SS type A sorting domain-containing protein [Terrimonas ginsenosidimutans]MCG2615023.1 T9SS type A sorting domain-containing protein [Terrimonas ginsenosidimutans]
MLKSHLLFLLLFSHAFFSASSQCLTALPPPGCTGTDPLLVNNETVSAGTTKWYYGPATTMNTVSLNGGTIVICSDLTINNFSMTGGMIFVRPGARLVLAAGSGAGLILTGNSAIYNYGTIEVQRNLSMEGGATAATPNIIINATPASILRMPFTYFVINNAHSWFVNNGTAEFGGVITDQNAVASSMCLGSGSITKMNILINKIANSYKVNNGNACVSVNQNSFFHNRLTNDPNLYACLSSGHTSYSGCGGCPANNWGSATTITSCSSCSALSVLGFSSIDLNAIPGSWGNQLSWTIKGISGPGQFLIERSADAVNYSPVASIDLPETTNITTTFYHLDKFPLQGFNYYMIKYIIKGKTIAVSKVTRVSTLPPNSFVISPMPFNRNFSVSLSSDLHAEKIIVTDMAGRNIPIKYNITPPANKIEIQLMEDIAPGVYLLHLKSDKTTMARTIFKQ